MNCARLQCEQNNKLNLVWFWSFVNNEEVRARARTNILVDRVLRHNVQHTCTDGTPNKHIHFNARAEHSLFPFLNYLFRLIAGTRRTLRKPQPCECVFACVQRMTDEKQMKIIINNLT